MKHTKNPGKNFGLKNYLHPDEFGRLIGYKVDAVDFKKNTAKSSLRVQTKHLSPSGKLHGGVVSAFLDFACGAAVFSTMDPHDFCSTIEIKVNYLRPIEKGHKLIAHTWIVFRGKRLCVSQGNLYRIDTKEPAAIVTATYNIVSKDKESRKPL